MILLILLCFLIRRVSQFVELIRNIIERLFSLIRTVFLNAIDLYDCDFNYNKFFFFYLLGKMLHDSLLFKRELIDNE